MKPPLYMTLVVERDAKKYISINQTVSYLFHGPKRAVLSDSGHRSHVVHTGSAEFGVEGIFLGHIDRETGGVGMARGDGESFWGATVDGATRVI